MNQVNNLINIFHTQLTSSGTTLKASRTYLCDPSLNIIYYPGKSKQNTDIYLISMLHEYGHIQQRPSKLKSSALCNILDQELSAWKYCIQWLKKNNADAKLIYTAIQTCQECMLSYCKFVIGKEEHILEQYSVEYK
jgi:hypothetical protein